MAHHDDTPSEVLQVLLQHLESLNVQVVGRLIQHQEVGISHQYRAEIELALFSTTQLAHVVMLLLRSKQEELQELRCRHVLAITQVDVVGYLRDDIYDFLVLSELQSLLGEITKANRLTDVELAGIGLYLAQQQFDECRFAGTVVAHDAHLLEAGEVIVEVIQDNLLLATVIEGLAHILALEYLASDIDGGSLQAYLTLLDSLLGHFLQLIEGILSISSLVSTSLRLAAHPVQFTTIEVLRMFYFGTEIVHALLSLLQIVGVVATIRVDGLVIQLQDDIAYLVQEETIVCHHENRLVATVQIPFQPFYHLQVEVVGRLVEHQEVWLVDENIGKGDTFLLSAAELPHRLLQVGDMQLRQDLASFQDLLRVALVIEASLQHGFVLIKLRRLLQKSDFQITSIYDIPALMSFLTHQHGHQS